MVRKTYSALAIVAIAAMSIVGCGNEDVTDLNDTWTKAENDLSARITEAQTEHTEIMNQFTAVPAADMDSTKMQDHATVNTMLQDHQTAIGEIETKFNELKAKREEAVKAGGRAEFEAAWNAAKAEYDGLTARLDELMSQHGDMKSKIDGFANAAPASNTDTAAAPATADTAAASADTTN